MSPTGCLMWTGPVHRSGYGGQANAHRRAWELARGPIPDGLHVLHRCDNRLCCYPEHLFLGTPADNAEDARLKGRTRGGRPVGSCHDGSLPTLLALWRGGKTKREIADLTGISERHVYNLLRGAVR